MLIEMEQRDAGVGAQHVVAGDARAPALRSPTRSAVSRATPNAPPISRKNMTTDKPIPVSGQIERVLHRDHHRRELKPEGEAEEAVSDGVERPRAAQPRYRDRRRRGSSSPRRRGSERCGNARCG